MKHERWHGCQRRTRSAAWMIFALLAGCSRSGNVNQPEAPLPRELRMTTLPPYVVEPPDILVIRAMNVVPKPPYRVQPLDALYIQGAPTPPDMPLKGAYGVEPDGRINLGIPYGVVQVAGMTIAEAQDAIQKQVLIQLKDIKVQVSLASSRGMQQIQGDHLVRMDGTIGLGVYGSVYIAGMTLDDARRTIETHLSQFLLAPEISLDVYSYNSKWYYVIADRAGYGQTVIRMPITGRETVLDAISQMYGTLYMSSNKHIWLARPNGQNPNAMQIFPVNWPAISQGASPATNYQLMPGDRLFVQSNPWIKANNRLNQFFSPIERVLGFTLLGTSTVSSVEGTILEFQAGASGLGTGVGGVGGVGGFR